MKREIRLFTYFSHAKPTLTLISEDRESGLWAADGIKDALMGPDLEDYSASKAFFHPEPDTNVRIRKPGN